MVFFHEIDLTSEVDRADDPRLLRIRHPSSSFDNICLCRNMCKNERALSTDDLLSLSPILPSIGRLYSSTIALRVRASSSLSPHHKWPIAHLVWERDKFLQTLFSCPGSLEKKTNRRQTEDKTKTHRRETEDKKEKYKQDTTRRQEDKKKTKKGIKKPFVQCYFKTMPFLLWETAQSVQIVFSLYEPEHRLVGL